MAKTKNTAAKDIVVIGADSDGGVLVSDQTDSGTRLADLAVIDRDTAPEYRNNVLTVNDERFEIRDGGLYLREGVYLDQGIVTIMLIATDATNPRLTRMEPLTLHVTHTDPAATLAGDTLTLNYDGVATITRNGDGGWHVAVAGNGMDLSAAQVDGIATIQLHGANTLDIAGDALDGKPLTVNGTEGETLNVSGVTFTQSEGGVSVGSNIDISQLQANVALLVNESQTDAFKAVWNYLDDAYAYLQVTYGNELMFGLNGSYETFTGLLADGMVILGQTQAGAAALAVNEAVTALDIAYATYLDGGGSPQDLTDFIAKTNLAGTRMQTLHDNLLGSVSAPAIGDRNFPDDVEAAFIAQIPSDYGSRPYASGNLDAYGHTDALTNAAKAWDYGKGIERSDYVTHFTGPIDPSGTQPDGTMWFGTGNPSTGYTIAIHDGAGVEFGWNVHYRTGDQIAGHLDSDDGLVHFDAPAGHQVMGAHNVQGDALNRSAVSLDYALVTGLNGTSGDAGSYLTKLLLDLDPTSATAYKAFTLIHVSAGFDYFLADDGIGGFGNEDGSNPNLAENSINFGYSFLADPSLANTGDFQPGTYDMIAQVWDLAGEVQLIGNHIVLDVS